MNLLFPSAIVLTLAASASVANAVQCGERLTTTSALYADLICDCVQLDIPYALEVVGPATLDLNGHTVSCSNLSAAHENLCISVAGVGAKVVNGRVTECYVGVGNHNVSDGSLITDIIATKNGIGFYLMMSDRNFLNRLSAIENVDAGIIVIGSNNEVENCHAAKQKNAGLSVAGNNNKVVGNTVEQSSQYGCMSISPIDDLAIGLSYGNIFQGNIVRQCNGSGLYLYASNSTVANNSFEDTVETSIFASFDDNIISGNIISRSQRDGIGFTTGQRAVISDNLVVDCAKDGIDLQPKSSKSTVKDNTIQKCGDEGIQIRGDYLLITGNTVVGCKTGIELIKGIGHNTVTANKVSESTLLDLSDLTPECGTNNWRGNSGTSNVSCAQKKF